MPQFALCNIMMMPVRSEPAHRAEMVNMLLFGEMYQLLESRNDWHYIHSQTDGYAGWINSRKPALLNDTDLEAYTQEKPVYAAEAMLLVSQNIRIGFGSRLPMFDPVHSQFISGNCLYDYKGKVIQPQPMPATVLRVAEQYLGTPYLWGGRSIGGIDCSGLTQMAYMLNGIRLPRDAWQQAEQGTTIPELKAAQPGDLIFFAEKEKISHVGVYTGDGHLVHASRTVVRERVDEQGIFNSEIEAYTLKPLLIKRYL